MKAKFPMFHQVFFNANAFEKKPFIKKMGEKKENFMGVFHDSFLLLNKINCFI